jgi:hypothetical protein
MIAAIGYDVDPIICGFFLEESRCAVPPSGGQHIHQTDHGVIVITMTGQIKGLPLELYIGGLRNHDYQHGTRIGDVPPIGQTLQGIYHVLESIMTP